MRKDSTNSEQADAIDSVAADARFRASQGIFWAQVDEVMASTASNKVNIKLLPTVEERSDDDSELSAESDDDEEEEEVNETAIVADKEEEKSGEMKEEDGVKEGHKMTGEREEEEMKEEDEVKEDDKVDGTAELAAGEEEEEAEGVDETAGVVEEKQEKGTVGMGVSKKQKKKKSQWGATDENADGESTAVVALEAIPQHPR
ncbi:retinitis pigmentosa GTPase regulator, putative [Perkinsus marinus ATCC 50983]|uniref:Retinitis pigmentosa GTPase regulator, putative n=1 Tax=Perkinsus marinus (strain ATCC 50983 / TXsc) TaxID=423536 RepID=C5KSG7_PERM5|nr:retinitis pigmentosa GTPase regulator, putative [Perkinsus marinus ATCC 50983]EER12581.1 retinitis pigmentosa GTPase regulator, putative [Perkinsus marinus ATCC 50983]|eukprot:XP_002780786.1 retinitis pigmentosa GTPase regulator, putative [Perkinsus marinus ATCC 50983]